MMQFNQLLFCLLCLTGACLSAQDDGRTVTIEPMGQDAIRAAIESDLAASDTATVEATTYILLRGATYPYNTQWEPTYSVTLQAEDGNGARPRILAVHPASGEAPRFMRSIAAYTFRGLHIPGLDSANEHTDNAPLRPRGDSTRVTFEDNLLTNHRFEVLRTDARNLRVYMLNNIIRDNYQRDLWNKNGGLFFQSGNIIDTIVFRDNTYFNTTGRPFHSINGAEIKYQEMVNNTFVNSGGLTEFNQYNGDSLYIGVIDFGATTNLICEDNIFYNQGFMGIRDVWQEEHFIFNMYYTDSTESVVIRNNNIYTDSVLLAGTPDTAVQIPLLSPALDSLFGGVDSFMAMNYSVPMTFNNAPMSYDEFVQAKADRWANPNTSIANFLELEQTPNNEDIDFGFSYAGVPEIATIGSSRWFGSITGLRAFELQSDLLTLRPNFPNPARSFTNIRFDLAESGSVSLSVFDMHGRMVRELASQRFPAGTDQLLPLHDLNLPAGTYAYALVATLGDRRVGATSRFIVR